MSTEKVNHTEPDPDPSEEEKQPAIKPNKKTLKEVVLEGLEEKGKGKDLWLW